MKSLHMTNAWHATSGGIATHYKSLLREAHRQNRAMVMIVPGEEDSVEYSGSTRVYTVRASPSPFNSAYRTIMPDRWPGVNSRVVAIVEEEQPDLVEICNKYSLHYLAGALRKNMLPQLKRRPVLIGLSCERMDENLAVYLTRSFWGPAFARWYMKWVYFAFFDHHIVNSQHVAGELRAASRGHLRERGIWVRPPGVDLSCFDPSLRHPELRPFPKSHRLVLYAGRLAPEKNLNLLMDAFSLVAHTDEHCHLVLAGDGMERDRLEGLARQKFPGRYTFLGHISDRRQLACLYANCDVFVHPNPAEPFGIAPLEAMASGIPFVGPDRGGILTYATTENAWLVPPDAEKFAAAIREVLEADVPLPKLAVARRTAEFYQAPGTASRFLELYEEFMEKGIARDPDYLSTPGTWLGSEL